MITRVQDLNSAQQRIDGKFQEQTKSIPNANDAPPIQQENESLEDTAKLEADLNELDQRSAQQVSTKNKTCGHVGILHW